MIQIAEEPTKYIKRVNRPLMLFRAYLEMTMMKLLNTSGTRAIKKKLI
jgi:hypothetical protein